MQTIPNLPYDIAIIGDGCSGWMLLEALSKHPGFSALRILMLGEGNPGQRSWCFWADNPATPYREMIHTSWPTLGFSSGEFSTWQTLDSQMHYHYIPGAAFFKYFQEDFLPRHTNIAYLMEKVVAVEHTSGSFEVATENGSYRAAKVYNSALMESKPSIGIWQHFRGWFIETESPCFDPKQSLLMDFNVPQADGCSFMYLLPLSETKALVELTFFSPKVMPAAHYDQEIERYLTERYKVPYRILEKETGQIPMQQGVWQHIGSQGATNLGTLAGMVKASTGYAFQRIRRDSEALAAAYFNGDSAKRVSDRGRFALYDALLLWIIQNRPEACKPIFTALFRKRKMSLILRFLDEQTRWWEEVSIFARLPTLIFLTAIYHRFLRGKGVGASELATKQ